MLKKREVWWTIEDHGSQYVSVLYNERLAQYGIQSSTGTVGD
ncbi:hypothetical protein QPX27_08635 [Corynebacterium pseudodiphtheriticum]|nr:hypothetical protein [Corynebacterium pseudodiphtheriticum]MDK4278430.1 hypothetical protein [Corynebacterium pseudodiphtheriticum]MDK8708088.1 hypothetical protein [Corynebacterium pseudodiphtheriticum]